MQNQDFLILFIKILLTIALFLIFIFYLLKFIGKKNIRHHQKHILIEDELRINDKVSLYLLKIKNEEFILAQSGTNLAFQRLTMESQRLCLHHEKNQPDI